MGRHTFDHPVPADRQGLGYDDSGNWELGVFPLLLALPKTVQLAQRVRQQRQAQGKPPVWQAVADRFRPQQQQAPNPSTPGQPAAFQPQAPGGGFFARFQSFRGEDPMSTSEDLILGALRRPGNPGGAMRKRMCRIRRRGGRVFAYDPTTGEEVEAMGFDDEDGGDAFGADDSYEDTFLGGEEGDDDDFDELGEAEEDLLGAADYDDDQTFGGKRERLEKKIDRLEAKAEKLRDKIEDMRGPLKGIRRKRLNKRLKKVVSRLKKARAKLKKAEDKRRNAIAKANKTMAAAAAGGAAAGAGAAGVVLSSRTGQQEIARMDSPLDNPLKAEQIRRAQAKAGLEGNYRAPAGGGRLQPVPMTQDGTTNPRNAITVPAGGISTNTTLFAETLSYATVRMVGFLSSQRGTDTTNGAIGLVEDLKIQGSGNLFLQEGPIPANYYDTDIDRLTPLRTSVKVVSPNQAQVDIAATGDQNDVVILTCSAVYDVLYDDTYGAGLPGPYA